MSYQERWGYVLRLSKWRGDDWWNSIQCPI